MTVTRPRIPAGFLIVVLAICCAAVRADAQLQDTDQRTCIKAVNKAGQGVLRAQGRENLNCLKRAGKGQLAGTFDECLSADAKQKVAKAQAKTVSADAKFCDVLPDVAYAGPSETNRAAAYEETRLVAEVVASSVLGPADGDNAVRCQATVTKLYEKSATTFMKAFNICVRKALASGPVVEATIEACIGADPNGKIQRAEEKVLATMIKRCNGVLLAGLNSGAFDGACDDADVAADCSPKISEIVRCRTCHAIARMDALPNPNCDLVDNGVGDGSCSYCGNGELESASGEACDDGNQVDGDCCDAECRLESASGSEGPYGDPSCSDGIDNDCDGYTDGAAFGCGDTDCPASIELLSLAGTSMQVCATNTDCSAHSGVCDPALGRCVGASRVDFGYTGLGHRGDTLDLVPTRLKLACPGPGPTCGTCNVAGLDSSSGLCRCANDNRAICDEPMNSDADDCGGTECVCYLAPPAPQSTGNTPTCWWSAIASPVTGTVDVDSGVLDLAIRQRTKLYLGINLITPCPYCDGDVMANDGIRDGVCVEGEHAGQSCDVTAWSASFPTSASGTFGGGASLDCAPDAGKNQSGVGIEATLPLTTAATQSLASNLNCGFEGILEYSCPCSICDNNSGQPCASNTDCSAGGVCLDFPGSGTPFPNQCDGQICNDLGAGNGECATGPDDLWCDGIVRADGGPIVACLANADCSPGSIGVDAGFCTIVKRRECFLDPIFTGGSPDPSRPVASALFCDAQDVGSGIGTVLGMPGPTRLTRESILTTRCSDMNTIYTPGIGGCP
jgi:cysteine-rich repeat protein